MYARAHMRMLVYDVLFLSLLIKLFDSIFKQFGLFYFGYSQDIAWERRAFVNFGTTLPPGMLRKKQCTVIQFGFALRQQCDILHVTLAYGMSSGLAWNFVLRQSRFLLFYFIFIMQIFACCLIFRKVILQGLLNRLESQWLLILQTPKPFLLLEACFSCTMTMMWLLPNIVLLPSRHQKVDLCGTTLECASLERESLWLWVVAM